MIVTYKKLWIMCAQREIAKCELRKRTGLSPATFTKLRRNQEISLSVLYKIASYMNCDVGDMMEFVFTGEGEDKSSQSEESED